MSSCLLFYGPGARQVAIDEAHSIGTLMAEPFGDGGLKTQEARDAVLAFSNIPVGTDVGTIVIGPMDLVMPRASDVLLKRIEEFDDTRIQPILWAHDVSGVTPTIQSRCLPRWVDIPDEETDQELIDAGFDVVEAIHEDNFYKIPGIIKSYKKREHDLIGSVADALSTDSRLESRQLWEQLRPITLLHNPTDIEILSALVGGARG